MLEAGAFSRSPLASAFVVLSVDAAVGPKSVTVTSRVQLGLDSGHPQSQYRGRLPVKVSSANVFDEALLDSTSGAPSPARRPQLVVTYIP